MKIKFDIRQFCGIDNNEYDVFKFVTFIKAVRDELNLGLKDAKDLCDVARDRYNEGCRDFVIVDLDLETNFKYLTVNPRLADPGLAYLLKVVQVVSEPIQDACALLKEATMKLLEADSYQNALDVLTVLIRLENKD
jgi:hypothetical protein